MAPGRDSGRKQPETCVFVSVTHTHTHTRVLVHRPTLWCIREAAWLLRLLLTHLNKSPRLTHDPLSWGRPSLSTGIPASPPPKKAIGEMTPDGCHGNCPPVIGVTLPLLLIQRRHINSPSPGTRCDHHWTRVWLGVCVHACVDLCCWWTGPLCCLFITVGVKVHHRLLVFLCVGTN